MAIETTVMASFRYGAFILVLIITSAAGQVKELTDPSMAKKLQEDLQFRNEQVIDHPVTWWDAGFGFYGTYSIGGDYITWYDAEGNYVATFIRKDWNAQDVPTLIRTSYSRSPFRTKEVSTYWEIVDQRKEGYFFEILNDSGNVSRAWANGKGKFSSRP